MSKEAGGDGIYRDKAKARSATVQVLDCLSNVHPFIIESEAYTNPAFCFIQKGKLVPGTFISLERKETRSSLNHFC